MTRFTDLLEKLGVSEDEIIEISRQGINTLHQFINVEKEEDLRGEDVRKIWKLIKNDFPNHKDEEDLYDNIDMRAEKYLIVDRSNQFIQIKLRLKLKEAEFAGQVPEFAGQDPEFVGQDPEFVGQETRYFTQSGFVAQGAVETIPIPDDSSRTFEEEIPQSSSTLQDATQPVQSSN